MHRYELVKVTTHRRHDSPGSVGSLTQRLAVPCSPHLNSDGATVALVPSFVLSSGLLDSLAHALSQADFGHVVLKSAGSPLGAPPLPHAATNSQRVPA